MERLNEIEAIVIGMLLHVVLKKLNNVNVLLAFCCVIFCLLLLLLCRNGNSNNNGSNLSQGNIFHITYFFLFMPSVDFENIELLLNK